MGYLSNFAGNSVHPFFPILMKLNIPPDRMTPSDKHLSAVFFLVW
ncbi:hypothetical protein SAMN04488090_3796 [Siphonobacter aquaeclarae]|uniref:Uncharacterized protein n=1 Tax=Siphonobacter aquaeclarae TaxID=563176 RepID=A0A1G9UFI3_9BACT|nr:hypothetical protein SAMN04488090_3796 [Siphonobacter aquaeclarae]